MDVITSLVMVRERKELEGVDGLVIPGGESTAISKLLRKWEMFEPLTEKIQTGLPVFGTCAGLILLAKEAIEGPPTLETMDISVKRNASGRQIESFEAKLEITDKEKALNNETLTGVFIRAPQVKRVGAGVTVLARYEGLPVLLQEENVLAATFHPELTDNHGVHKYFLDKVIDKE